MAEAPTDLSTRDNLEQKILQVLSDAGVPVKTAQLVKECQVPKKLLNQVLYRLKKEAKVSSEAPATWRLGGDAPGDAVIPVPEVPAAQSSHALRPQQDGGAVPGCPGPQLSAHHERIYRFLEANGPCKALHIAQALGMRTAKDVNPDLYAMRNRHLLNFDGQTWTIYGSGQGSASPQGNLVLVIPLKRQRDSVEYYSVVNSGGRQQSAAIIYQQSPINMICQQGANSHISIANSRATQIGHGNVIQSQTTFSETGLKTPHHLPLPVPEDPSAPGALLGAWGTQDIYMEKSMLRRVQLGHSNQMNLLRDPGEDPAYSFSCSSPVSAPDASSEASFNVQTPEPAPYPKGDMTQKVHIKSCFLEDATIGNSNEMTVHPGSEGAGGVMGSEGSREPKEDPDPSSDATPRRSCFPATSSPMSLTSELKAVTLEDNGPQTIESTMGKDAAPIRGSQQPQA